jgi:hypothetical protein
MSLQGDVKGGSIWKIYPKKILIVFGSKRRSDATRNLTPGRQWLGMLTMFFTILLLGSHEPAERVKA